MKTTILGILAGLALIIPEIIDALDDNEKTIFNTDQVLQGLALMGLGVVAKDRGISPNPEVKPEMTE